MQADLPVSRLLQGALLRSILGGSSSVVVIALPNKVIEYVACGLGVLAFPHRTIKHFIERNRVGLVGKNVNDLAKQLAKVNLSELQLNIKKNRRNLVIEEKIGEVIQFYQRLVDQYA